MKTGIVCAIAFVVLVSGLNANPDAESRDENSYRRLLQKRSISEHQCSPGATKKVDCNNCYCNGDGSGWACTRMECITDLASGTQPNQDEPLNRVVRQADDSFSCVPNSTFMNDCNTCYCEADGRRARCTLMGCFHEDWPLLYSSSSGRSYMGIGIHIWVSVTTFVVINRTIL